MAGTSLIRYRQRNSVSGCDAVGSDVRRLPRRRGDWSYCPVPSLRRLSALKPAAASAGNDVDQVTISYRMGAFTGDHRRLTRRYLTMTLYTLPPARQPVILRI